MAGHDAFCGLAEVVPQMPAIGDLDRLGRTTSGSVGIGARAVTTDDTDTGMPRQPRGHGVRRSVRQQIDRPVGAHVDEHGAVVVSAAEGEIVHSDFAQLPGIGHR
ncbi:hypothetical protein Actkin_03173 [Actinokineospora sp. UTMC 2448]|nr:hypothetical protein Actkin_03173 [Actinokineospora sp. UTMC 2448]